MGVEKAEWVAGDAISVPGSPPPDGGNLRAVLLRRQDAAVTGLGPLGELDLDHSHHFQFRLFTEGIGREPTLWITATEIAGADLPHQVAAVLEVPGTDATLAGVVGETAELRALVQGQNRVATQSAETHRGHIEDACRVGLAAGGTANGDAQVMIDLAKIQGRQGMSDPFIAAAIGIDPGAKGHGIPFSLGALIDDVAEHAVDRGAIGIRLDEVLPHIGPQCLHQPASAPEQRKIAQDGMADLQAIVDTQSQQRKKQQQGPQNRRPEKGNESDRKKEYKRNPGEAGIHVPPFVLAGARQIRLGSDEDGW